MTKLNNDLLTKLFNSVNSSSNWKANVETDVYNVDRSVDSPETMAANQQIKTNFMADRTVGLLRERNEPVTDVMQFVSDITGVRKSFVTAEENRIKKAMNDEWWSGQSDNVITNKELGTSIYNDLNSLKGAPNEQVEAAKIYAKNENYLSSLGIDPNASLEEKIEALKPSDIQRLETADNRTLGAIASSFPEVYRKVKTSGVIFRFKPGTDLHARYPDGVDLQTAIDEGFYSDELGISAAEAIRREIANEHFITSGGTNVSPAMARILYAAPVASFMQLTSANEGVERLNKLDKANKTLKLENLFTKLNSSDVGIALSGGKVGENNDIGFADSGILANYAATYGSHEKGQAVIIKQLEEGIQPGYTTMSTLENLLNGDYYCKGSDKENCSLEDVAPILAKAIPRLKTKVSSSDGDIVNQDFERLKSIMDRRKKEKYPWWNGKGGVPMPLNEQREFVKGVIQEANENKDGLFSTNFKATFEMEQKLMSTLTTRDEFNDDEILSSAIEAYENGNVTLAFNKVQNLADPNNRVLFDDEIKKAFPYVSAAVKEDVMTSTGIIGSLINSSEMQAMAKALRVDIGWLRKGANEHYQYAFRQAYNNNEGNLDAARDSAIDATRRFVENRENWLPSKNITGKKEVATQWALAQETNKRIGVDGESVLDGPSVDETEKQAVLQYIKNGIIPAYFSELARLTNYKYGGTLDLVKRREEALTKSGEINKEVIKNFNPKNTSQNIEGLGKLNLTGPGTTVEGNLEPTLGSADVSLIARSSRMVNAKVGTVFNLSSKAEHTNLSDHIPKEEGEPITVGDIFDIASDNKKVREVRWGIYGFTTKQILRLQELGFDTNTEFSEDTQTNMLFWTFKDIIDRNKRGLNGLALYRELRGVSRQENLLFNQLLGQQGSGFIYDKKGQAIDKEGEVIPIANQYQNLDSSIAAARLFQDSPGDNPFDGSTVGPWSSKGVDSPIGIVFSEPVTDWPQAKGGEAYRVRARLDVTNLLNNYGGEGELRTSTEFLSEIYNSNVVKKALGSRRFKYLQAKAGQKLKGRETKEQKFYELLLKEEGINLELPANFNTKLEENRKDIDRLALIPGLNKVTSENIHYGKVGTKKNLLHFFAQTPAKQLETFSNMGILQTRAFNDRIKRVIGEENLQTLQSEALTLTRVKDERYNAIMLRKIKAQMLKQNENLRVASNGT